MERDDTPKKFVFDKVVSVSPNVVTIAINKSGELEKITSVVFIDETNDELAVYRKSSSVPTQWSRDIYKFSTVEFLKKDDKKYPFLPILPQAAVEYVMENIRFSATVRLSNERLQNLATKLRSSLQEEPL
mgnify:CR=1 FL=1